jgi:hypothetical protein
MLRKSHPQTRANSLVWEKAGGAIQPDIYLGYDSVSAGWLKWRKKVNN